MIKALIFKEWLKIRWMSFAMSMAFLLMLGYIYINTSYYMRFLESTGLWYNVVIRGMVFYGGLYVYLPVVTGILIGIVQIIPEINSNRLKLTLHLPMKENQILLTMIGIGTSVLLIIDILSYLILSLLTIKFFPMEVLYSVWITSLPWYVAGLVGYWSVMAIAVEISWLRRVALIIITFGFLNSLFYLDFINTYANSIHIFLLLGMIFVFQIFLSGSRFRKGVL